MPEGVERKPGSKSNEGEHESEIRLARKCLYRRQLVKYRAYAPVAWKLIVVTIATMKQMVARAPMVMPNESQAKCIAKSMITLNIRLNQPNL